MLFVTNVVVVAVVEGSGVDFLIFLVFGICLVLEVLVLGIFDPQNFSIVYFGVWCCNVWHFGVFYGLFLGEMISLNRGLNGKLQYLLLYLI